MSKRCKINEIIVVEGKHDSQRLKLFFDCETIETNGLHLDENTLKTIQLAQKQRGVIVFTDPDFPGESIRKKIVGSVNGCKHAWIDKNKAKTSKKVGIEHANEEDLFDALKHLIVLNSNHKETYKTADMLIMGLIGSDDSRAKRNYICNQVHMGMCNSKTFMKRLNMMNISKDDLEKILTNFKR